jgi:acetylornithine deacetylase/succinyl-diaminopimelate desuccinylase-like protein
MKRLAGGFIAALLTATVAGAATVSDQVRAYRVAHETQILEDYFRLLEMPNVATRISDVEKNAAFITEALNQRGFRTRLLSAGPGTPPAIYGELTAPHAKRTVVFYAHYDGQPAGQAAWRSDPFKPVIRAGTTAASSTDVDWRSAGKIDPEWRIYGRSASDDKAPIQAMLTALDALKAAGRHPTVNIKLFYEGEEEQGSGHLPEILRANHELLAGDVFVLSDGPRHVSGRMQVFFGARGVAAVELTVYGPNRPLHSGHYGNWAPNPAVTLTHLLASMRDEEGHILIPGFYADVRPLSAAETAILADLPDVETGLKRDLAIGRTEGSERLANAIAKPALNIRGVRSGDVGEGAANAIPTDARASIDFRLVPDQTPEHVREETEAFLRAQGWYVVTDEPDMATRAAHPKVIRAQWSLDYPAYRADMNASAVKAVVASIARSTGAPVLTMPMLGGSVPMYTFAAALHMPIVGVPLVNADNNQHGANENLRIQNLWEGIEIYAGLLTDLGR